MEDQKIGDKCEICKRRDYIPFECKKCNKKLCNDHFWDQQHKCRLQYNPPKPNLVANNKQIYNCLICKLKLTTINHYYCQKCNQLFCIKHRLPQQHKCTGGKQSCQLI